MSGGRRRAAFGRGVRWFEALPAPAMLASFYAAFIAIGAVVLWLPVSNGGAVTFSDALFTAVSAVTVTGLVVVDTGSAYTVFGQAVIAVLIQLGGLGLMVFAVVLLMTLGLPVGLPAKAFLREELNQGGRTDLARIAKLVLTVALICEGIGMAVLSLVFVPQFGWWEGLWHAAFHTVSAFNNAGFALFPDSLSGWIGDWRVNLIVPAMFILGGLGFVVIGDVWDKRAWGPLALHTKLMLVGTVATIAVSWALVAALEWNNPNTLGGMGGAAKFWGSWFQAVTPRTAGFNTMDTGGMEGSTALLTMVLMVVGAGPTSTAGGIKLTTAIVAFLAVVAFFKRRERLHAFGRSMGPEQVLKAMALVAISAGLILVALFLVSVGWEGEFLVLAFEVTSAFGTVGLSMGATGELDGFGRAVIMAVMFLGRVGPLTLGFFLATRSAPRVQYPRAQVVLG